MNLLTREMQTWERVTRHGFCQPEKNFRKLILTLSATVGPYNFAIANTNDVIVLLLLRSEAFILGYTLLCKGPLNQSKCVI